MNLSEATAEARRRMEGDGLILPDALVLDGKIHRVPVAGGKPRATDGYYHGFTDPPHNITWKNHKTGEQGKLVAGEKLTPAERQEAKARAEANGAKSDEDLARRRAEAAKQAQAILARSIPLPEGDTTNPYLMAKGVAACPGLYALKYGQEVGKFTFPKGSLVMPISDAAGKLTSLQFIAPKPNKDGGWPKHQLKDGKKQGCGFVIEGETASGRKDFTPAFANTLMICEGLATGLSLHEATNYPVLVAIDAGNLLAASQAYREAGRFKSWTWLFCADNDDKGEGKRNTGVESATEAARAVGGLVAIPRLDSGGKCDWNDVHQQQGIEEVRRQLAAALASNEDGDNMAENHAKINHSEENRQEESASSLPDAPRWLDALPAR